VPKELQVNLDTLSREFFNLPHEEKEKISMKLGGSAWRGWFPVGDELTSGKPDQKEGLYLGQELGEDHPRVQAKVPLHGRNLFPEQPAELGKTIIEWQQHMS
jgi:isopenicillin N synthase-like dioxygenase